MKSTRRPTVSMTKKELSEKYQNLLMRIMKNIEYLRTGAAELSAEGQAVSLPGNSIRMALAFVGILPIIIVYPMLQKYFIKGVVVGAVKG